MLFKINLSTETTLTKKTSFIMQKPVKKSLIQGVSKRLLKVQVSITSLFYGAGDLKFCTDILQNYTI